MKFKTSKKGIYKISLLENSDRLDAKTIIDTIYVNDCNEKYFKYFFNELKNFDRDRADNYDVGNSSVTRRLLLRFSSVVSVSHPSSRLLVGQGKKKLNLRQPTEPTPTDE